MVGRVVVHGERRAREMEEVSETLRAIGVEPIMAEAAARRQQWSADLGLRSRFPGRALRSVEFVEQSLIQTKGLLPTVELVPRLLGLLFVGSKIKSNITMSHDSSLRRAGRQVKIRRIALSSLAKYQK